MLIWSVSPLRPCIWGGNAFSWVWRSQELLLDTVAASESGCRCVCPGVPPTGGRGGGRSQQLPIGRPGCWVNEVWVGGKEGTDWGASVIAALWA